MKKPLRLVMIYGSVRPGRFCDTVASWAAEQIAASPDFELDVIDPGGVWPDLPEERFRRQIDAADALLIITPEYNHSFPGPLKTLIDAMGTEWRAKPVAFVSYGGVSGGLRAVEHLRNVFIELHAVPVRDSISFHNAREAFADGKPIDELRRSRSIQAMLRQLAWWARALHAARTAEPYGVAA
jgi:NAD(P)H-dependent FMN reductase